MSITTYNDFNYHSFFKNAFFNAFITYLTLVGVFLTAGVFAADSSDLLTEALASIKNNFGLSSVFVKCLYLMEIYYGWRKWRETHNPLAVGGVVLVAMYLTYAIGKWVGA